MRAQDQINRLGLEDWFAVVDNGGPEAWAEKDPEKRYEVIDAEMATVCRCADRDMADLVACALNEIAAEPLLAERFAWARLVKATEAAVRREDDGRPWAEIMAAGQERDAAEQALRDLGVDVDALLNDG